MFGLRIILNFLDCDIFEYFLYINFVVIDLNKRFLVIIKSFYNLLLNILILYFLKNFYFVFFCFLKFIKLFLFIKIVYSVFIIKFVYLICIFYIIYISGVFIIINE